MKISITKNGKVAKTQKIDQAITNIVNICAAEKKNVKYDFATQKNLVALELTWSLITPYLEIYDGITKTNWRAKFKDWLNKESPKKLKIKGIRV